MIYTHTIGRIGAKDCRIITGTHGTFMAVGFSFFLLARHSSSKLDSALASFVS